jgi:hypothetical protein
MTAFFKEQFCVLSLRLQTSCVYKDTLCVNNIFIFLLTISGLGNKSLFEVAELIRNDEVLFNEMIDQLKNEKLMQRSNRSPFGRRMLGLLNKSGDRLLKVFIRFKFEQVLSFNLS